MGCLPGRRVKQVLCGEGKGWLSRLSLTSAAERHDFSQVL